MQQIHRGPMTSMVQNFLSVLRWSWVQSLLIHLLWQGFPTSKSRAGTFYQISSSSIRLEIKCTINIMHLNHLKIIPSPLVCGRVVFHKIGLWCQKDWAWLYYGICLKKLFHLTNTVFVLKMRNIIDFYSTKGCFWRLNGTTDSFDNGFIGHLPCSRLSWRRRQWYPLQDSCLENPMDRGAWWAAGHGVSKSWTQLSDLTAGGGLLLGAHQ